MCVRVYVCVQYLFLKLETWYPGGFSFATRLAVFDKRKLLVSQGFPITNTSAQPLKEQLQQQQQQQQQQKQTEQTHAPTLSLTAQTESTHTKDTQAQDTMTKDSKQSKETTDKQTTDKETKDKESKDKDKESKLQPDFELQDDQQYLQPSTADDDILFSFRPGFLNVFRLSTRRKV